MNFIHETNKIYMNNEEGRAVAQVTFPQVEEGVVNIDHTLVDDSLAGQGIAGRLMEEAYQEIKEQGQKALLACSYAIRWFEKHPEYRDILEEQDGAKIK